MTNRHFPLAYRLACLTACMALASHAYADGLYVATDGSVGIGTSTPGSYKLNINGGAGESKMIIESTSSVSYDQSLTFKDPGGEWILGQRTHTQSNDFGIGQDGSKDNLIITETGEVGINMYPTYDLDVIGIIRSSVGMAVTAFTNSAWDNLCVSAGGGFYRCGLSSKRHKESIKTFSDGLDVIKTLHPVRFFWKDKETFGASEDIGLVAEDVAAANPELTYSKDGQVEGVHYSRLTLYLINAVKEQPKEIEALRQRVDRLSRK